MLLFLQVSITVNRFKNTNRVSGVKTISEMHCVAPLQKLITVWDWLSWSLIVRDDELRCWPDVEDRLLAVLDRKHVLAVSDGECVEDGSERLHPCSKQDIAHCWSGSEGEVLYDISDQQRARLPTICKRSRYFGKRYRYFYIFSKLFSTGFLEEL